jgi:hypothetical protein
MIGKNINRFNPRNLARAKKHVGKMLRRIKDAHRGGVTALMARNASHCLQERRKRVGGVNSMLRGSQC